MASQLYEYTQKKRAQAIREKLPAGIIFTFLAILQSKKRSDCEGRQLVIEEIINE
jgi:hypothetical protein